MSEEIPQELIKKIGQVALTIAYGVHGLTGKKMPGIPSIGASPQQVSQNPAASLSLMNKSRTAPAAAPDCTNGNFIFVKGPLRLREGLTHK